MREPKDRRSTEMENCSIMEWMDLPATDQDPGSLALLRVGQGDLRALRWLVDEWKQPLIGFFYRSTRSHADAEELAFQAFDKLHRAAPRYQPSAKFTTFLFTIARNLLITHHRKQKVRPTLVDADAAPEAVTPRGTDLHDWQEVIEIALAELDEAHRTPLLLATREGLSHQEIARVLRISTSNVKVRIHRARKMLKTKLQELS